MKRKILLILIILIIVFLREELSIIGNIKKTNKTQEKYSYFEYKYFDRNKDGKYNTLITFRNLDGIDRISYIDNDNKEIVIIGNGKKEIGIDFKANSFTHYFFITISLLGERKTNDLYLEIIDESYQGEIFKISNSNITSNSNISGYGSPQKMFDGNTSNDYNNYGCYINGIEFPLYINFILDKPRKIYKMRYFTYGNGNYQPTDFTIEGSNDTTNGIDGKWEKIKTYQGFNVIASNKWGEFFVGSNVSYKAYRMNITKIQNTDNQFLYNEMELYDY